MRNEFHIERFGENLRSLRKSHRTEENERYTQAKLAEKLEVNLKTIQNWEKGATYPENINIYLAICEIFDCDLDYLVGKIEVPRNEVADVMKITGLSEKTINEIILFNNPPVGYPKLTKTLDTLLSFSNEQHGSFWNVLGNIDDYWKTQTEGSIYKAGDIPKSVALLYWAQHRFVEFIEAYGKDLIKSLSTKEDSDNG